MSQTNGFRVRPFQRGDEPGVRRVLEETYGENATPAQIYDWWSFGYKGADSGFMVAECNDSIVGVQPMEIFEYHDGPRFCKGGMLTGVAVHPEFRRRGIFSQLVEACERRAWDVGALFVTTMPNERSLPGFLKLGYQDLGRRRLLIRLIKPAELGASSVPVLGYLGGAIAGYVQAAFKPIPVVAEMAVSEVKTIDQDVSELCLQHERLFPGLRLKRSVDWWRWRFLETPRLYRFLEARTSDGELSGVAVTTTGLQGNHRVSYLVDLAVSSERALKAIVSRLCMEAQAGGSKAIGAVISSRSLAKFFNRAGFWSIPNWAPVKRFYSVVRFNPSTEIPKHWHNIDGWYQTFGDWDNL